MIVTFVGISGSGKSTLTKLYEKKGFKIISPDLIRKELTGSISDQSKNTLVFKKAHRALNTVLYYKQNAVFDATNLDFNSLNQIAEPVRVMEQKLIIYLMLDSIYPETCRLRVESDITNGVDRSKTSEGTIILKQSHKFQNMLKNIDEWAKERKDFVTVLRRGTV